MEKHEHRHECVQDLRSKEVIDVCNGRRLGYVADYKVDICTGRLTAIIVPGGGFGLWKSEDVTIPWEQIQRIGEDLILVEM